MNQLSYPFGTSHGFRYTFISDGKKKIEKIVEFMPTGIKDLYNVAFGDLLSDGSINDMANTNNGDIAKVLSTVIQILKDFTARHPNIKVVFTGSTNERTRLYGRILRTYHEQFKVEFKITAFVVENNRYVEVSFDPQAINNYYAFFIQRIS